MKKPLSPPKIGVYAPKFSDNIGTLWRSAHIMGAAEIFTIGKRYKRRMPTDTLNSTKHVAYRGYPDVDEFLNALDAPLIAVENIRDAIFLAEFAHPVQGTYVLGAEDYGLPPELLEAANFVVQIEPAHPSSLNLAVAGSIVLWDRLVRGQG